MVTPETEEREREREEGGRGAYLRQRGSGLDSWLEKPLVPGLSSCWLGRVSSAAGPQTCESRERTDLRSYGNKTNSESAEVSDTVYSVTSRSRL